MRKNFLLYSGLITIIFVFIQFTVGLNFEFLESFLPSMLSGKATNGHPLNIMFFSAHYPLADLIYVPFYKSIGTYFPFYETSMYACMIVSGSILASVVHQKIRKTPPLFYFIIAGVLAAVYLALIINLQHTIVAFLVCTSATSLIYMDLENRSNRKKIIIYVISILLFTLGLFIRVQVGVFFAIINLVAFILLRSTNNGGKYVIPIFLLITVTHYGILLKNRNISTDYCQKMDLVIGYQLMDRGNIVPISSMQTYSDSVKYLSVINSVSDPKYITTDFIETLIASHPILGIKKQFIIRAYDILFRYIEMNKGLLILYLAISLVSIWSHKDNKRKIYGWTLFNLFCWGLIALVIYNIKMELWLFRSIFFTIAILHILNINANYKFSKIKGQLFSIACIIALALFIHQEAKHFSDVKQKLINHKRTHSILAQKCAGKIVVPGLSESPIYMANFFPFETPDYSAFKHIYYFDTDVLFWQERYNKWAAETCQCETGDMISFMDYLSKNQAAYITTKERTEIIKTYCSVIRNVDYEFKAIDSLTHNGAPLYIFNISRKDI